MVPGGRGELVEVAVKSEEMRRAGDADEECGKENPEASAMRARGLIRQRGVRVCPKVMIASAPP